MAANIAPVFIAMQKTAGCSEAFCKYLADQQICDAESYGLLASSEAEVNDEILESAKAAGINFPILRERAAVKRLWTSCRRIMDKEGLAAAVPESAPDTPLPVEAEADMKSVWHAAHGPVPPDSWLLIPSLQGKLWRGLHPYTPRIDVILLEH